MKQQFSKFRDARYRGPRRATLTVPSFILSVPAWTGSSDILGEFAIGNSYEFSLRLPIAEFGENFILAIRWVVDNISYRYKLWDNDDAVLHYPIYNGEKIGVQAIIEIWSINSLSAPTLDANTSLETSVLVFPEGEGGGATCSCNCAEPVAQDTLLVMSDPSILPPGAACNPFCDCLIS